MLKVGQRMTVVGVWVVGFYVEGSVHLGLVQRVPNTAVRPGGYKWGSLSEKNALLGRAVHFNRIDF